MKQIISIIGFQARLPRKYWKENTKFLTKRHTRILAVFLLPIEDFYWRKKEKGVYHINIVDEITQWEILGCVERISEYFLTPLLEDLITQFPFKILGFHSDNGSEFINKVVAQLLNKLLIQ